MASQSDVPKSVGSAAAATATAAAATTPNADIVATHYDILGIHPHATHDEIKAAFHRLARKHHPDRHPQRGKAGSRDCENETESIDDVDGNGDFNDGGSTQFRKVHAAWDVLGDADRRGEYDQSLLQLQSRGRSRRHGALTVRWDDDEVAEAFDEETNEVVYVYDCRCGEEIVIGTRDVDAMDAATRTTGRGGDDDEGRLVDCPGCCFVYRVVGL